MGLWSRVQRTLWTGEVVKDYGVISDGSIGRQHRTVSVVLAEKQGRRLFIRVAYRAWGAASVQFIELDRDIVMKLDAVLHDALERM
jgi:hypothetical protein